MHHRPCWLQQRLHDTPREMRQDALPCQRATRISGGNTRPPAVYATERQARPAPVLQVAPGARCVAAGVSRSRSASTPGEARTHPALMPDIRADCDDARPAMPRAAKPASITPNRKARPIVFLPVRNSHLRPGAVRRDSIFSGIFPYFRLLNATQSSGVPLFATFRLMTDRITKLLFICQTFDAQEKTHGFVTFYS